MATLGKPEIPTPGAMNLRVVQQAVDNIRERFKAVEAAVALNAKTTTQTQASAASALVSQVAILRAEVAALATVVGAFGGEDLAPAPLNRATMQAAVAAAEQFEPAAPWRVPLMRLTERVEALEMGSAP